LLSIVRIAGMSFVLSKVLIILIVRGSEMEAQMDTEATRHKKGKRILLAAVAVVVVLVLLAIFAVPAYLSSAGGHRTILAKINDATGGEAAFSGLSMSWLRGIEVDDFRFADGTGNLKVAVEQILTKPHYGSILFGGLSFGRTVIEKPRVEIQLAGGRRKTAGLAPGVLSRQVVYAGGGGGSGSAGLPIKRIDMVVNDGVVKVTGDEAGSVEVSQIQSEVNLRPPGETTKFEADMKVTGGGAKSSVEAKGAVRPSKKAGWSLKGTSGDFVVEVKDLELESLELLFGLAGIEIDAKGKLSSDITSKIKAGQLEDLSGTIKGENIEIGGEALKGDKLRTSVLDVDVKLASEEDTINIDKLNIRSDWANAEVSGVVPMSFESLAEFLKPESAYDLQGSLSVDLAGAFSQMPRTFGLKEGMQVTSGKLKADIVTSRRDGRKLINGSGRLEGLAGTVEGKAISLSAPVVAKVAITSDKTGVKYNSLALTAAFGQVTCTGSEEVLKYEANIDLAKLQSEVGEFVSIGPYDMAGKVVGDGSASIGVDGVAAAGSSVVRGFRLSSAEKGIAEAPEANIDFAFDTSGDTGTVNVDFLNVRGGFGRLNITKGTIPFGAESKADLNLPIQAMDLDLGKVRPFAVLLGGFPKEMELAGVADSKLGLSSDRGKYRVVTDSTKIKGVKVVYPGKEPFEQEDVSIIFDVELDPAVKSIDVRKLEVISDQIKIRKAKLSKTSKGSREKLEGHAELEYDWSALGAVAGPFLPQGLTLRGKRKDTIDFSSEYPLEQPEQLMANLSSKAKVGFDSAEYMGLNFGPTEVAVDVEKGLMKIAPFTSTVNKGKLSFEGEADFNQKPTVLKTPGPLHIAKDIHVDDIIAQQLLQYLNPLFAGAADVNGVADFNTERLVIPLEENRQNDIEIIGTIGIRNILMKPSQLGLFGQILSLMGTRVSGQKITVRPTRFVLQNGILQYDDMQIDIGDNPVNFKGIVGLDKRIKNMTVTLPYTWEGRTARVGEESQAPRITLPVKGTIDNPEIDTAKLLEEQFKQQLQQRLPGLLEGLLK